MKDIKAQEVAHILHARYPNAQVYVLDDEYELPTREMIEVAYKKFEKSLWKYNVFKWIRNKWDCDSFAWCFKAQCTVGNALSSNNNSQPIGFLCYFENGDKTRGHAINNAIFEHGEGSLIREIEPQPKNGIKSLTKEERDSAWLVIV
jgi:hypothetical protein